MAASLRGRRSRRTIQSSCRLIAPIKSSIAAAHVASSSSLLIHGLRDTMKSTEDTLACIPASDRYRLGRGSAKASWRCEVRSTVLLQMKVVYSPALGIYSRRCSLLMPERRSLCNPTAELHWLRKVAMCSHNLSQQGLNGSPYRNDVSQFTRIPPLPGTVQNVACVRSSPGQGPTGDED